MSGFTIISLLYETCSQCDRIYERHRPPKLVCIIPRSPENARRRLALGSRSLDEGRCVRTAHVRRRSECFEFKCLKKELFEWVRLCDE